MTILLVKGGKRMKNKWVLNIGAFLLVGSLLAGCGTTTDDDIIDERNEDVPLEENDRDMNRNDNNNQNDRDNNIENDMEDNLDDNIQEDRNDRDNNK